MYAAPTGATQLDRPVQQSAALDVRQTHERGPPSEDQADGEAPQWGPFTRIEAGNELRVVGAPEGPAGLSLEPYDQVVQRSSRGQDGGRVVETIFERRRVPDTRCSRRC